MKTSTKIAIVVVAVLLLFGVVYFGVNSTRNNGKTDIQVVQENAGEKLTRLLAEKVQVTTAPAKKATVTLGSNELKDELPDISIKYPLQVTGNGSLNIEIFSSPEKAGKDADSWLIQMAEMFNREKRIINGQTASVSLRSISSGLAADYILSGKYVPQGYSPSNEMWGGMLTAQNVKIELIAKRMVGNLAGIMMSPQTYDKFIKKYGAVNAKTVVEATAANEASVGYTSPFTSSTGLNFLSTTLYTYDPYDLFSDKAIKGFESFQANVPFVAYTTQQMANAASGGELDAFVNEYQTYINKPEFKAYTFVPFGMRHDNPMYSVGTLTPDQAQLLKEFTDYCLTDEAQAIATRCGFNFNDTYVSEVPAFSGKELLAAQSLWKEKKDSGQTVVAVFIADVSGSMGGSAIANLKSSLKNAAQYINSGNYIGLVSYSSNVTINLPIGKFDINQRAYFEGAVGGLTEGGNTATFDAVLVGLDMLLKAKANIPNAKPLLFVLSDGDQNWGQSLSEIKPILEAYQIPINTIGYNDDNSALKELANINEGAGINADTVNVVYELKNLLNSQM